MRAEEISVGDWFEFPGGLNIQIWSITKINDNKTIVNQGFSYDGFLLNELNPIPITPEILEKNGFIKRKHPGYLNHYTYEMPCESLVFKIFALYDTDFSFNINNEARKIEYVHELQHALRLCKIDKEIVL